MKNFLFLLLLIASCNSNSRTQIHDSGCNSLPKSFTSYPEAVAAVESADFAFTDEVNTNKSSWIRAARFYSCNNSTGYFLIETDRGNYIHQDVPIAVWESFKSASSFGSFYNANIKHRYRLTPHQ